MQILFIHSFDYYEPIGLMTLSAFLKQNGHQCELLDVSFEKKYINEVLKIKPDLIAYSVTTNNWKRYQAINLEIKRQYKFTSIFGGPHCTFFPDMIMQDGVDIICRGEGEHAFLELANAIQTGNSYTNIQNLWVKIDGNIFRNDIRPLIQDLDELPFPDRDLINKYRPYRNRSRVRTIASRGCPYNCSYCFNHSYKSLSKGLGKFVRQRTPSNMISELIELKRIYNPRNFEFHDDTFILNKSWFDEFIELYISNAINIPFEINVRVDLVTHEIAQKLKKAGCYSVQFGIESGNERIRNSILNRQISENQIINASEIFRKEKIKINTFNLVGIPTENLNDVVDTIRLNAKCKVTYAMNSIFQPYPGTQLTKFAIDNNYYDGSVDTFDKNYLYGKSIIQTKDIKKIERLHYLFAFGVKFPKLIPLIILLSKLPLNKIYQSFYFLYRAFYVIFVFKRLSIKEILLRLMPDK